MHPTSLETKIGFTQVWDVKREQFSEFDVGDYNRY